MTRLARPATGVMLLAALLAGCAGTPSAPTTPEPTPSVVATPTTIRIASLKGPTTMGLVGLVRDAEAGEAAEDYQVTMYGTPDEVVPLVVQGGVDVALVPANLASVLYNRTKTDDGAQVQVVAINTLGMLEVLEAGEEVQSLADLEGRTVYSTGKGASPEYVLNYLLTSNDIDPSADLTIEYRSEPTEVAAVLASEPGAVGVLPQPFATIVKAQNPGVRTALELVDEWDAVTEESKMVTGVVVVRTEFAQAHPDALDQLLTDYAASTQFTNDNPAEAAPLVVEAGIVPSAPIAEAAIPACNITFIEGAELRSVLGGYLEVLFEADPASVGGSLPADDFYYRR